MGFKARSSGKNYELKTKMNDASVRDFLGTVENSQRKKDSMLLLDLMEEVTGEKPKMWGTSIVGFGSYDYQSKSGIQGTWPRTGFSPRKQSMTVYCMPGFKNLQDHLARLGRCKTSVSCLYIPQLDNVDLEVLRDMVRTSFQEMNRRYPPG